MADGPARRYGGVPVGMSGGAGSTGRTSLWRLVPCGTVSLTSMPSDGDNTQRPVVAPVHEADPDRAEGGSNS